MIKQFKSWSHSRWNEYEQCPLKAKLKHLDKIAEPPPPPGSALERGTRVHQLADAYVRGTGRNLPPDLKKFESYFKKVRKIYAADPDRVTMEQMWGFNRNWEVVAWDDWYNCWLRVKMDLAYVDDDERTVHIIDYKTGKHDPTQQAAYKLQLELYAVAALHYFSYIDGLIVKPALYYLDHGIVESDVEFVGKDRNRLVKTWESRTKKMFTDRSFKAQPSAMACKWCFFKKANAARGGGQCVY